MLSTIHKLFSGKQTTAEKSEEVEQQQYIQYAQEVGMDALTHAVEAYVCWKNTFTKVMIQQRSSKM